MRIVGAVVLALAVLAGPAAAQGPGSQTGTGATCLQAGRLIAEPGRPALPNQTVRITDGRIAAIAPGFDAAGCTRVIDLKTKTVLPGVIDSHVHITSEQSPMGRIDQVTKSPAARAFDGARFAERTVLAGVTTAADLGGDPEATLALRDAIAAGIVPGPRLLVAGAAITPKGGHGDVNGFRAEVIEALSRDNSCNGADDCRRATRAMIQRGVDLVKVTATGGVLSNTNAGLAQQLMDDELRAIVETATSMGRNVVAHAHGLGGINAALRAGVRSIEHGSYADPSSFKLFKEKGAYLVPTIIAGVFVAEEADRPGTWMPAPVRVKAREVGPLMLKMAGEARKAGVKVAFGTDTGVSPHGQNLRELELMVQAGFTPAEALRSATVVAAEHLGLSSETGRIAPGLAADVIAVAGDPLTDISTMRDVHFVMARGQVMKP
jgi:imidazolonepropionase-like amidohydrolase